MTHDGDRVAALEERVGRAEEHVYRLEVRRRAWMLAVAYVAGSSALIGASAALLACWWRGCP